LTFRLDLFRWWSGGLPLDRLFLFDGSHRRRYPVPQSQGLSLQFIKIFTMIIKVDHTHRLPHKITNIFLSHVYNFCFLFV
jgi:hypothetical protein